jgi:hypothetical protein
MDETIGFDGKYIIMKSLEVEKWIFFKDEDGEISMRGLYDLKSGPIQGLGDLMVRVSDVKPGQMTQSWSSATDDDYTRLIDYLDTTHNFYFKGMLAKSTKYTALLRESLRERKLKQIGI